MSFQSRLTVRRRVRGAIFLALVLGTLLRGVNIAQKPYWHDEVFTTMRVAGYTGPKIEARVLSTTLGNLTTAAQLQQLQTHRDGD